MRLVPIAVKNMGEGPKLLEFFMGKNTPERKEFIVNNLAEAVI